MNIEQYRALKAKEENEQAQEGNQETEQALDVVEEKVVEEPKPIDVIEIDGKEVPIEELKNGYLRQSDYTKKTQKLASEKKEIDEALRFYEQVKNNPDAIESLRENVDIPGNLDPTQKQLIALQEELYDMKLDKEIELMQSKYKDFEVLDVLTYAGNNEITNLEDAYILMKSKYPSKTPNEVKGSMKDLDLEQLKADLKKELMAEIDGGNTDSLITSKQTADVSKAKEIIITPGELKVADGMGLSAKEYATWRDANK